MFVLRAVNYLSLATVLLLFTLPGCGGGSDTADSSASPAAAPASDMAMTDAMDETTMMAETSAVSGEQDAAGAQDAEMMMETGGAMDEAMVDTAATTDEMMGEYQSNQYQQNAGGYGGGGNALASRRPQDVSTWSDSDVLEAVGERDPQVLMAIQVKAEASQGDPAFVGLMTEVLVANAGGPDGRVPGEPGFPRGFDPDESDAERPVPPGGASLPFTPFHLPALQDRAVTSIEVMLGQSLLGYAPQATQAIRGSAERMQESIGQPQPNTEITTDMSAMPGEPGMASEYNEGSNYGAPAGGPMHNRAQGALTDEELLHVVVRALITNNTAPAWKTLSAIQKGRIASPLSKKQKAEILLTSICEAPAVNPEAAKNIISDSIMLTLAKADEPRLLKLLTVLGGVATDHFLQLSKPPAPAPAAARPAMAGGMNGAGSGAMTEAMMGSENLAAYDGGNGELEGYGAAGANQVRAKADLPVVNVSPEAILPVATALWMPENVDAVCAFLDEADASASLDLLALATVIPSDKVRHSVFGLFERLHEQGAAGMVQSGLFSSMVKDPGMLTVLKALPRNRNQKPAAHGAELAVDPKDSWSDASLDAVLSLRDRLKDVSSNPALRYEGQPLVPLHGGRSTLPEVSIAIETPSADAASLGKSQPSATKIYYTRVTVAVSPENMRDLADIADHYEKRSNGVKHEMPTRGLLWYDGVKKNSDGTRQSMDVIIEQAKAAGSGFGQPPVAENTIGGGGPPQVAAGPGQRFTIEVIVVKTRDPKEGPTKADVASK